MLDLADPTARTGAQGDERLASALSSALTSDTEAQCDETGGSGTVPLWLAP